MKKPLLLFLVLALCFSVYAGDEISRHGLTFHVGGSGSACEFEYQYRFVVSDKHAFSASVGINTVGFNLGFPLGLNYSYGQKNQLLVGLRFVPNMLFGSTDEEVSAPFWSYLANLRIGYGRELLLFKQDFTFYIYASPFMNLESGAALPWAGIALTHYF
jgi:hypothetical protein